LKYRAVSRRRFAVALEKRQRNGTGGHMSVVSEFGNGKVTVPDLLQAQDTGRGLPTQLPENYLPDGV